MIGEAFGPYTLVALLGRGGMGEVWRAHDTRKDRAVAVKVLGGWLGGDPGFAARFQREAALAARLYSPHIIPIHDYGDIAGRFYIEMPLVAGTDLEALIARHGPMSPERAVAVIEQIAEALDTAHDADLLHRDIKPSNILVNSRRDGKDFAYLIDFGIACAADGTKITTTGRQLGTLAYMAPERFSGDGDRRSDVYALACVLHAALTGAPPFLAPPGAHDLGFYVNAHLHLPPPPASATAPGVPGLWTPSLGRGWRRILPIGLRVQENWRWPLAQRLRPQPTGMSPTTYRRWPPHEISRPSTRQPGGPRTLLRPSARRRSPRHRRPRLPSQRPTQRPRQPRPPASLPQRLQLRPPTRPVVGTPRPPREIRPPLT